MSKINVIVIRKLLPASSRLPRDCSTLDIADAVTEPTVSCLCFLSFLLFLCIYIIFLSEISLSDYPG
jgi:hypothetical protein